MLSRTELRILAEELWKLMEKKGSPVLKEVLERRDEYISVEEASGLIGYSKSYLYKNKNDFPYTRIGRKLMFSKRGIEKKMNR